MAERVSAALPIASCSLDSAAMNAQRERYRRLGRSVSRIARRPGVLSVEFAPDLETELVEETVAVERECCPFFRFDFDPAARSLTIGVESGDQDAALDALRDALA
jgi:hypothetical protein